MKKEIADQWVAALTSGKFKQAKNALREGDGYCCLGVLCALAPEELGKFDGNCFRWPASSIIDNDGEYPCDPYEETLIHEETAALPYPVMQWSGVRDSLGNLPVTCSSLSALNDSGKTFDEIANIIEKHWEEL